MTVSSAQEFPIDAVITWVDGADPRHKNKLDDYLSGFKGGRPAAANPSRFHNSNEIEYCVVSLLRFAPWIRKIFIVTDQQQPLFIEQIRGTRYEDRVIVVDHSVIFAGYEWSLPTFNSMSISSMLWRIPALAEHFLFLNDDFSLIRPVSPDVFYRNGKVVLRGRWHSHTEQQLANKIMMAVKKIIGVIPKKIKDVRVRFIGVQENSAKLLGYSKKVFQLEHNPHPWRLSTWKNYFANNQGALEKNISYKLRSNEQFVPEGFSAHYELKANNAIVDNSLKTLQLKPADQALTRLKIKLAVAEHDSSIVFLCVQGLENADVDNFSLVKGWLDKKIGLFEQLLAD